MSNLETVIKNHTISKNSFLISPKQLLDELYLECEHGDEEHRKWLKDKFDDFLKKKNLYE